MFEKKYIWVVLIIGTILSFWQMYRIIFGDFWAIVSLIGIFMVMRWQVGDLQKIEEKEWLEKMYENETP